MKIILCWIETLFRKYLGINCNEVSLSSLKMKNGKLKILYTESFKRHSYIEDWENFKKFNIHKISTENKSKLGIAMGGAIAKNLVITFENINIQREL